MSELTALQQSWERISPHMTRWTMDVVKPIDARIAEELLQAMLREEDLFEAGRRNDDAVDLCIALHVLGYDAEDAIEALLLDEGRLDRYDMIEAMDHVLRVSEYLEKWGPDNDRGAALSKCLNLTMYVKS